MRKKQGVRGLEYLIMMMINEDIYIINIYIYIYMYIYIIFGLFYQMIQILYKHQIIHIKEIPISIYPHLHPMKDNHFKLSNSFTSLFAYKGNTAIPTTTPTNNKQSQKSKSLDKGLFKLNPKSANVLEDVPVSVLRQKSKSKLESLKDDGADKKWSIFQQKMETKEIIKQKKITKKYHLDPTTLSINQHINQNQNKQVQLAYDIVRPSKLDQINLSSAEQTTSTLFQTPLLPCFASQFRQNLAPNQFKAVEEKEGVWKIGKIKMKGNKAMLNIGGIQFQACKADVSGRAGVVSEQNFYQLPNWKSIWVVQPSQALFN